MLKNLLPDFIKGLLIRHFHNVKKVHELKNVTVKIAETFSEHQQASILLHNCYVAKKLMEAHPSGMRCNIHSFLPHCTVIIAVNHEGKVIGTVSIIQDTSLGLPADKVYVKELKYIRHGGKRRLVEVSALAIDPEYRKESHALQFLLNRYLYIYCRDFLKINTLVIIVHPSAQFFYNGLLLFKPLGKTISYSFVKGALASLMYLDFSGDYEKRIWENKYHKRKDSLVDYILNQKDDRLIFKTPLNDNISTFEKAIAKKLIEHSVFDLKRLDKHELSFLVTGLNLNKQDLLPLGFHSFNSQLNYRFIKELKASGVLHNRQCTFKIINLSASGAFIEMENIQSTDLECTGTINFKWKGAMFNSLFVIRWINEGHSDRLPRGIGIEFLNQKIQLFDAA